MLLKNLSEEKLCKQTPLVCTFGNVYNITIGFLVFTMWYVNITGIRSCYESWAMDKTAFYRALCKTTPNSIWLTKDSFKLIADWNCIRNWWKWNGNPTSKTRWNSHKGKLKLSRWQQIVKTWNTQLNPADSFNRNLVDWSINDIIFKNNEYRLNERYFY